RDFLDQPWPDHPRDIDILFVGNLHPAVQRERLPWLGRLAQLAERWEVVIRTGVHGEAYRNLLGRARIVFNRSIRGECNCRVFEAAAAGALLFQEEGNQEVGDYFRDRQECIFYSDENLESLLEHYLGHEDERRTIAEVARADVSKFSFEAMWEEHLALLDGEWPDLQERVRQRASLDRTSELLNRTWQAMGNSLGSDPQLVAELSGAVTREPTAPQDNAAQAELHNA